MVLGFHRRSTRDRKERERREKNLRKTGSMRPTNSVTPIPVVVPPQPMPNNNQSYSRMPPPMAQTVFTSQQQCGPMTTVLPPRTVVRTVSTSTLQPASWEMAAPVCGTGFNASYLGAPMPPHPATLALPAPVTAFGNPLGGPELYGPNMMSTNFVTPIAEWESMQMVNQPMRTAEFHETHVQHETFVQPPPVTEVLMQEHHHHHTEILPPSVHEVVHQEHHHHHQRVLPPDHIVERQDVHVDHFDTVQPAPIVNHVHQAVEHFDDDCY